MEQLEFKFVTDEKRKDLEEKLSYAEIHLQAAKDNSAFGFPDVLYRQSIVKMLKKKLAELK